MLFLLPPEDELMAVTGIVITTVVAGKFGGGI